MKTSRNSEVLRNASALFSAHLVGRLLSLILTVFILPQKPNVIAESDIGCYFLAVFIAGLVASITELGLQGPLIREITLNRDLAQDYIGNALIIRLLLSILAFGFIISLNYWLNYTDLTFRLIILLGAAELINGLAQIYRCLFRAFEQMKYESVTVIAERLTVVLVGGGLIWFEMADLGEFGLIVLIGSVLNLILNLSIARLRFVKFMFHLNWKLWKTLMKQALPFALGNMFNLVYFRLDMILLSKLITNTAEAQSANAWYGLAFTIVNAFTILPGAYMGAVFPVMSREFERKTVQFRYVYTDAIRWMVLLALPFAIGFALVSEQIAAQFFPKLEWRQIVLPLRLLSISGGVTFLTTVNITVLRATDQRLAFSILMFVTLSINLFLNLLFIPQYQHVGAALSMIGSESMLLIMSSIFIHRSISKLEYISFVWKSVIVSILMAIGLYFTPSVLIWIRIFGATVVYFGLMWLWGELDPFKKRDM